MLVKMSKPGHKLPSTRAPRFSEKENIVLLREIESRLLILTDSKEPSSVRAKQQAWNEIARNVTSVNTKGETRTRRQVQQKWFDLKCFAKKLWKNTKEGDEVVTCSQAEFAQKMIPIIRTKVLTNVNFSDPDDEFNDYGSNNDYDLLDYKKEGRIQNIAEQDSPTTNHEDYNIQIQTLSSVPHTSFQTSDMNPTITVRSISRNVMKNHVEQTLTNVATVERTLTPAAHIESSQTLNSDAPAGQTLSCKTPIGRFSTSNASVQPTLKPSAVVGRTLTSDASIEDSLNPGAVVQTFTTNSGPMVTFNPAVEKPLTPCVERTFTLENVEMSSPYKVQKLKVEQEKLEIERKKLEYIRKIQKSQFTLFGTRRRRFAPTTDSPSTSQVSQELNVENVKLEVQPESELVTELSDLYSNLPEVQCNEELENAEDANLNEYTSDTSEEGAIDAPLPPKRKRVSTPSRFGPQQSPQNNVYGDDIKEILKILKESAKPPDSETKSLDEDEQFMSSMTTALKKIEPKARYSIKMKIMKLIYDSVFAPVNGEKQQS